MVGMWDSRVNRGIADGWFSGRIPWELTVRVRACPAMEADHDLAMSQPLVASDRMLGRLGPTVEHVALGYRIRPCNIDYER